MRGATDIALVYGAAVSNMVASTDRSRATRVRIGEAHCSPGCTVLPGIKTELYLAPHVVAVDDILCRRPAGRAKVANGAATEVSTPRRTMPLSTKRSLAVVQAAAVGIVGGREGAGAPG